MRAAELVLAAYLGGALSYGLVLLTPSRVEVSRATWAAWAVLLALMWPASIALMHEWQRNRDRGRS